MKRHSRSERGAAAVEAALVTPLLLLVILGGIHFGKVLTLRHQLAAATDVATRTASLAQATDSGVVRGLIEGELGSAQSSCQTLTVQATERTTLGIDSVEVRAVCTINRGRFSSPLTGFLGPDELSVVVAMPL